MTLVRINSLFSFLLIFVMFKSSDLLAGTAVGNGGDIIFCEKSTENPFYSYYSLDYFVNVVLKNRTSELIESDSFEEIISHIYKNIYKHNTSMAESLLFFVSQMYNEDYTQNYVWEIEPYGLAPLSDEMLVSVIPDNCVKEKDSKPNIIQSIIRITKPSLKIFSYDAKLVNNLKSISQMQFSFLILHEWLWNFTDNADTNRRINFLMHTKKFDSMKAHEFVSFIDSLGATLHEKKSTSICEKNYYIRNYITQQMNLSCSDITDFHLTELRSISAPNSRIQYINGFEFVGLNRVKSLMLENSEIEIINEKALFPLTSLYELNLAHNKLRQIVLPDGIQLFTPPLSLNLSYNSLEKIINMEKNRFKFVDLSNNNLARFDLTFIKKLINFGTIDLSYNKIEDIDNLETHLNKSIKVILTGNPISNEKIKTLREKQPDITIIF